jgi:hypothetical protein
MADLHGHFLWYELKTIDAVTAIAFYTKVLGWGIRGSFRAEATDIIVRKRAPGVLRSTIINVFCRRTISPLPKWLRMWF